MHANEKEKEKSQGHFNNPFAHSIHLLLAPTPLLVICLYIFIYISFLLPPLS